MGADEKDPLEALKGSTAPAVVPQVAKADPKGKQAKLPKALPVELPVEAPAPQCYVVQRKVTVPWFGRFITLHEGSVVSDADYGPGCMEKMRNLGVALEPAS